jgi:hypothetical protein
MTAEAMQNLFKEFGETIGIPDLQPDEENRCNLMFDEVAVSFELNQDGNSIYVYSYLGDVPSENREQFYAGLLDANYTFKHTQGATLGVEYASKKVLLIREYGLEAMRLASFEHAVEQFVNLAEYWKQKMPGLALSSEQDSPIGNDDPLDAHTMKV